MAMFLRIVVGRIIVRCRGIGWRGGVRLKDYKGWKVQAKGFISDLRMQVTMHYAC